MTLNKAAPSLTLFAALLLAGLAWPAQAQLLRALNPDWTESQVPDAPAFDVARMVELDVARGISSLKMGIDPGTLSVGADGVVRYVFIAQSASGVVNASYEGIRCASAEYKVYARSSGAAWRAVDEPQWQSNGQSRSGHARYIAGVIACDGRSAHTLAQALNNLRYPRALNLPH